MRDLIALVTGAALGGAISMIYDHVKKVGASIEDAVFDIDLPPGTFMQVWSEEMPERGRSFVVLRDEWHDDVRVIHEWKYTD